MCHLCRLGLQAVCILLAVYLHWFLDWIAELFRILRMQNYLDPVFWLFSCPPVSLWPQICWCRIDPPELPLKPPEMRVQCCDTLGMWEVLSTETSQQNAESQLKCLNSNGPEVIPRVLFSSFGTGKPLSFWSNQQILSLSPDPANEAKLVWQQVEILRAMEGCSFIARLFYLT